MAMISNKGLINHLVNSEGFIQEQMSSPLPGTVQHCLLPLLTGTQKPPSGLQAACSVSIKREVA